jgi:hypothetical protein
VRMFLSVNGEIPPETVQACPKVAQRVYYLTLHISFALVDSDLTPACLLRIYGSVLSCSSSAVQRKERNFLT